MDYNVNILEEFRDNYEVYRNLRDDIEDIFMMIIKSNEIKVSNLSIRIKEEKSLSKKIMYKNKYQNIADITDVVACRIITLFEDDVERLKALISENFYVVEQLDKRKKENTIREEYGYNSLHLILQFTKERCALVEYAPYKDISFEVQIRTSLQHAWCEIEHGLGYKSAYEIPKHIRRRLNRLSATIELLDEEFVSIAKAVEQYNCGLEHQEKIMRTDINLISLKKYVLTNPYISEMMRDFQVKHNLIYDYDDILISSFRVVQRFTYMGYGYIHEIDELIGTLHKKIEFVGNMMMDWIVKDGGQVNYYICLIWVAICNMMENDDERITEIINPETVEMLKEAKTITAEIAKKE